MLAVEPPDRRLEQIGAGEHRPVEARAAEAGAAQIGAREIGAVEIGHAQIGGEEHRLTQRRDDQQRAVQPRAGELGLGELALNQVDIGEVAKQQQRAATAGELPDEALVPRQDLLQLPRTETCPARRAGFSGRFHARDASAEALIFLYRVARQACYRPVLSSPFAAAPVAAAVSR